VQIWWCFAQVQKRAFLPDCRDLPDAEVKLGVIMAAVESKYENVGSTEETNKNWDRSKRDQGFALDPISKKSNDLMIRPHLWERTANAILP
jgi:hypothetical protein